MKTLGKFIVIDGTDGSGKGTQFQKLITHLQSEKLAIATFDFPQYGRPSAYFVEQYLNGYYGPISSGKPFDNGGALFSVSGGVEEGVGPEMASLFFAMDRFGTKKNIIAALDEGKITLSNRYVSSNMGHQGAKIHTKAERTKFFKWVNEIEYDILKIPKPDITVILHMPAAVAQKLVDEKGAREYIGGTKKDLHENNLEHLKRAEQVYLEMAAIFPEQYLVIECMNSGRLMTPDEIHERVWEKVSAYLKI